MKKITVNKSDEAAVVVEKIIDTDSREVVLSIPRFSHLAESLSNFHLLKREADALDKKIFIESVDDRVIELAQLSGLKAINPFFAKSKRQFSDIVAPRAKKETFDSKNFFPKEEVEIEEVRRPKKKWLFKSSKLPELLRLLKLPKSFKLPKLPKVPWKLMTILVLVTIGFWVILQELPRVSIEIITKKADWSYNDSIMTTKSAKADSKNLTLPNQIFIQKKNIELKFSATGRKQVEEKATGKMIVYNSYSSDPQPLVVRTRFLSSDGKLFRTVKRIIVPGAIIVEGQIVPSSIEADVIADQSGPNYNIEPVKLFTIPGFKKCCPEKYKAFYGESKESMSGGFIGEVAYPTQKNLDAAKAEVSKTLEDNLEATVYSQIPAGFKILDDAVKFEILTYSINKEVDVEDKFSVFGEAKMTMVGFKEESLLKILSKRAEDKAGADFEVKNIGLKYGLARTDFQGGKMSFLVNFKADLSYRVDVESLRNRIVGKPEIDLKAIIFSLPGVESAIVSLWPFWVNKVPVDLDRIKITVD